MLNSLSHDFISTSTALLREGGHFAEIGKRGVWSRERSQQASRAGYTVVALDDVAGWLAAHGVRVIRADNTHRQNAMMKSGEPSQHALGMAIDIMAFERRDGRVVPVLGTWPPRLGQTPCGPGSPAVASDDERWLRGVVCDLARRHAFHHMLTPNTDAAHRDHLHFDLDPTSTSLFLR